MIEIGDVILEYKPFFIDNMYKPLHIKGLDIYLCNGVKVSKEFHDNILSIILNIITLEE